MYKKKDKEKPEATLPAHREDRYMVNLLGNVQGTPHRADKNFKATVSNMPNSEQDVRLLKQGEPIFKVPREKFTFILITVS